MYRKSGIVQKGFTLMELLIVVIIVAILAAIVVPQFSNSSTEAKEAALDTNLAAMRSAVELYKLQHRGALPGANSAVTSTATGDDCKSAITSADAAEHFQNQLTKATNAAGQACGIATAQYKYGPYLKSIPKDPFMQNAAVTVTTTGTMTTVNGAGGWFFDTKLGELIANVTGYDDR